MSRRAGGFVDSDDDPRATGPTVGGERAVLAEYLRAQRLTLEMKCQGLSAEELARRSVEPSTMSLLGLVRHLADVERGWMRGTMSGLDAPPHWRLPDTDGDFDGAVADPDVVADAWARWREECAFTDEVLASMDLDATGDHHGQAVSLREVAVHLIEEYARHNGHADLLRERIDGRVGE
jgi:uncharacterized damage-inducible protein DinB